ncbi:MAG: NAD(P)/FAD-dependent oxidoreductase [Caldilineaceae bacterium]
MTTKHCDVLIIGGGPAGSTAATYLAQKGYQVTVVEKEKFPREHVGESLLPFCYNIFQELGVLTEMERRFVRKPGVRFLDVDGRSQTTWCFAHVLKDASQLSFHVIRAEFDQMLLQNSAKHGVTVHEETRVNEVNRAGPDGSVVVQAIDAQGALKEYRTRFLLDASGRDTFLATRMGAKIPHKELGRAALSTHWLNAKFEGGIEEGLLQIIYLGGEKKGWIWVIPLAKDRLGIGVVLEYSYLRRRKDELQAAGVEKWQEKLYLDEVMSSPFVRSLLPEAYIAQPLMANSDYSYFVEQKYGPNFAMIGDASTFIDPIFSSGIYLAMNSARLVTQALHEQWATPTLESRLAETYQQINGAYAVVDRAVQLFYNPSTINFAQASSASALIHQQHADALAIGHYVIAGDFFEKHAKYNDFFDLLQKPALVSAYRNLVINRAEFQSSSCSQYVEQIFQLTQATK